MCGTDYYHHCSSCGAEEQDEETIQSRAQKVPKYKANKNNKIVYNGQFGMLYRKNLSNLCLMLKTKHILNEALCRV